MLLNKWSLDHQEDINETYISKIPGGYIPARQECPFISECELKAVGKCWHGGLTHPTPYLCSTAKLIDIRKRTG